MAFSKSLSRRDFLKLSAAAAGGVAATNMIGMPLLTMAQDTTEITIVSPGRDLGNKYNDVIIQAFNTKMEADGKSIRAKASPGPATDNDYKTKITLDAASGTLGDVVSVNGSLYADMAAAGYLLDLTDMLATSEDWKQYSQVVKDQLVIDGKIYAISGPTTFTMFYRKDVLADAGISTEQPATWDDFFARCEEIAAKTKATPAGIPAATPWGGGTWEEGFRHVWMGFAEADQIYDPSDKKWVVKSDGLLKALQVYETLASKKWLTVDALLSPNPWEPIKYQGFPAGTVAVVTGGDWQWEFDWGPNGATPIDDIFNKVDRWLFPSSVGKPFPFISAGGGNAIFSQSKNAEAALDYILFADSPQGSCKALETYFGGPSARADYADNCPYYKTAINGKMYEAGLTLNDGRFLKPAVGESRIADGIAKATEAVITGAKTADQAMSDFADYMKDQIGEEGVKEL
ncbi:MAG: extracellular solute-binding protein [Anaerolineaceae bacterium]|nr:extracellular solute-binding protein [Anaerolineaceae bacterium]